MGLVVTPHRSHQKQIEGQNGQVNRHGQQGVGTLGVQHEGDEQKHQVQQGAHTQHVAPKELGEGQPAVPSKRPEALWAGLFVHG
jgi:hypothetical protein